MLLEGYARDDDVGPLRLSQKIPVTYPVACVMRRLADASHGGAERLAMRAAIAVAYGLSLRPGEYLTQADDTPLEKQMKVIAFLYLMMMSASMSATPSYTRWEDSPPTSSACLGN